MYNIKYKKFSLPTINSSEYTFWIELSPFKIISTQITVRGVVER